jgi:type VI secretion system protein ImpM
VAGIGLREALQLCGGKSLWWHDHARTPDTSLSLTADLPDAGSFALLLEGKW